MATLQQWKIPPVAFEVSRLRHAVVDYGATQGISPRVLDDVALAVSEVLTNAVVHAYPGDLAGTIAVTAEVDRGQVAIRVTDDGVGMRRPSDTPGAGYGLSLAGKLARQLTVEPSPQGGTEVSLRF